MNIACARDPLRPPNRSTWSASLLSSTLPRAVVQKSKLAFNPATSLSLPSDSVSGTAALTSGTSPIFEHRKLLVWSTCRTRCPNSICCSVGLKPYFSAGISSAAATRFFCCRGSDSCRTVDTGFFCCARTVDVNSKMIASLRFIESFRSPLATQPSKHRESAARALRQRRQRGRSQFVDEVPHGDDGDGGGALHFAGRGVANADQDDAPDAEHIERRRHSPHEFTGRLRVEIVRQVCAHGIVEVKPLGIRAGKQRNDPQQRAHNPRKTRVQRDGVGLAECGIRSRTNFERGPHGHGRNEAIEQDQQRAAIHGK